MQQIDTIIECKWLLTMTNDQVLNNHAVAINENKIIAIDTIKSINNSYTAKNNYALKEHALMPGLINAHTHSPMVLLRSLADNVNLQNWLHKTIWPAEQALMSEEYIKDGFELAIAEMILNGTTCINEHYFFTKTSAQMCNQLGIRATIGIWLGEINSNWAQIDNCIDQGVDAIKTNNYELINYSWAPHSTYLLNDSNLRKLQQINQKHPQTIHIHCHETALEIKDSLEKYNKTPIERLHQFDLLNNKTCLIHMVHNTKNDLNLVNQYGASIITCPKSNFKLASGIFNTPEAIDNNINLGIGTDSAASNNQLSILDEARALALNSKIISCCPAAISAYDCLYAATMGNAKALGMSKTIGSIETGKYADLIAINLNHLNTYPQHNIMSLILYAATTEQITHNWINGIIKMNNRTLVNFDLKELNAKANNYQQYTKKLCN